MTINVKQAAMVPVTITDDLQGIQRVLGYLVRNYHHLPNLIILRSPISLL